VKLGETHFISLFKVSFYCKFVHVKRL